MLDQYLYELIICMHNKKKQKGQDEKLRKKVFVF